jgi:hypothetical protein
MNFNDVMTKLTTIVSDLDTNNNMLANLKLKLAGTNDPKIHAKIIKQIEKLNHKVIRQTKSILKYNQPKMK